MSVDVEGKRLFEGVSFDVGPTQTVSIMGRSGTGKSTLLNVLLGLTAPSDGQVMLDGVVWSGGRDHRKKAAKFAEMRRHSVGMVYQGGELFPELTAAENVQVAGLLAGMATAEAQSRAGTLLAQLKVRPETKAAFLSGGEVQRVSLARALINKPRVLLADEPTGSLDAEARDDVCQVLYSITQTSDCALILVTHDLVVADQADQRLALEGGRLRVRAE